MTRTIIRVQILDGNMADYLQNDDESIDIAASLDRWENAVRESLETAYPHATIWIERERNTSGAARSPRVSSDDPDVDTDMMEIDILERIGSLDDADWIIYR